MFSHPDYPEAGIQVPAGTVKKDEEPEKAVLREALEETGLDGLEFVSFLGKCKRNMSEFGVDEIQHAWFYHLRCTGEPPNTWRHGETSGGQHEPIWFDFFWAKLPNEIPELIALNGVMLPKLLKSMGFSNNSL